MSQPRPHAPFAARLLAFTIAVTAVFDMLVMGLQRRAFANAGPDSAWESRSDLFGLLEMASRGGILFAVLLACLAVIAALRYRRDVEDNLTRNLALGAAITLGLEGARQVALELLTIYSGPTMAGVSGAEWAAYMQWWSVGGMVVASGALTLVVWMTARTEQAITRERPTWALVAGASIAAYVVGWLIIDVLDIRRDPFAGLTLIDLVYWLGPVAALATAIGLVVHAGRIRSGEPDSAWGRAAGGLGRYKRATALRLLLAVFTGLFITLARTSLSPLVLAGTLGTFALVGVIISLVQIAGLVRLADAPTPPAALAFALPLFGLGVAFECVTIVPIASFVSTGGGNYSEMRFANLTELGLLTQALGIVTAIALLLALRGLALAREAPAVVRRCTVLLVTLLTTIAMIGAAAYALPKLRIDRDTAEIILLVGGAALLIVAIFILVSYFRTLTRLQDAMTRRVGPGT